MPGELVLLHGFTRTGRSWDPVVAELGERYRAFAPDLPGHGSFSGRRPVSFGACVAYLAALPTERYVLCGYSMGGRVALRAALDLPERVARLVLVSASAGIADDAERARRRSADEELARRVETIGLAAFAEEWGSQPLLAGLPRGLAELAREDRLRNTADGLAAALRGLGQGVMEPLWGRLAELKMPVTVVVGERDEKYTALAARIAESAPEAKVIVVPGAGHAVQEERPEAVAEALG